jgi:hypothetical protein
LGLVDDYGAVRGWGLVGYTVLVVDQPQATRHALVADEPQATSDAVVADQPRATSPAVVADQPQATPSALGLLRHSLR